MHSFLYFFNKSVNIVADCGRLPVPQHGHVSPTATSYGSTATISCDNGFKLIGSGISTCGSDGRWNSTGQTCTPWKGFCANDNHKAIKWRLNWTKGILTGYELTNLWRIF
ncbi:hypothetical protein DPMN_110564 [Dreissena polymorpha]|uniref:Sushi domain-containing protein n=1 Tax=Dreissena polymorpha TaxID=45954 RepID=A0A9D4KD23_DREPO|nr:hypothetical protein DPMN_110564 [Dreissena polymorpha]